MVCLDGHGDGGLYGGHFKSASVFIWQFGSDGISLWQSIEVKSLFAVHVQRLWCQAQNASFRIENNAYKDKNRGLFGNTSALDGEY